MREETIYKILKFRDDRDWKQFHNPKDLAISISLEAAELLEVFQWSGADVSNEGKQDLDEIVQEKIKINERKYPVEKAKGRRDKYDKL